VSRPRPVEFEFGSPSDPELAGQLVMVALGGTGWINVEPIIDDEFQPPEPGPFAFLGGSTHKVPVVTWMPGKHQGAGSTKDTTVGLQHATGPRVAWRLRDLGHPVPEGWRVTQDHPRRGLVASVPAGVEPLDVMGWLLGAAEATCQVPMTGRWRGTVHPGIA